VVVPDDVDIQIQDMIATALALVLASSSQRIDLTGHIKLSSGANASLAAVWLVGAEKSKPLSNVTIDQRNREFLPHVTVVTLGTKVAFPNNDTVLHNVFADYNAKVFDLGSYPRGITRHKIFDKTGLVVLLCNMHSEMGAFIVVVDTPYYAVADPKGKFSIKDVPPGKYTVHGWHESNQVFEQEMSIGAGTPLNINLVRRKR
jgi:plastocyanin